MCQACDFADCADRSRARGALSCECGVARPSVKGQPVDVKQSILHAWHQPLAVLDLGVPKQAFDPFPVEANNDLAIDDSGRT